jgi:hypothetical protein
VQFVNLDMDGKDERYRRHMYSFTRTLHGGVYLGMAQVYHWPRSHDGEVWGEGGVWEQGGLIACERAGVEPESAECKSYEKRFKEQDQQIRTYLATSRDGIHFDFGAVYSERPLLPRKCNFDTVVSRLNEYTNFALQYLYLGTTQTMYGGV